MSSRWHSAVPCPTWAQPLAPTSQVLAMGSCFAEHMGNKLLYYGLQGMVNPFGVIFNPTALADLMARAVQPHRFETSELVVHQGLYHHPLVHSRLSGLDAHSVIENLNNLLYNLHQNLQSSTHIFLTLGTAWVYRDLDRQLYVANCHKRPAAEFEKVLLSVQEIEQALGRMQNSIRALAPQATLVWTISPVRHAKDGWVGNQRSKAHLISALHTFLDQNPNRNTYFPAYELLLDELRDYRFYADDMLHPTPQAIDYIWERLQAAGTQADTQALFTQMADLRRMEAHRPLHSDGATYALHQEKLAQKKAALQAAFPHVLF